MKIESTAQAAAYFDAQQKSLTLFVFVINRVLTTDWVAHTAKAALDGKALDPDFSPSELARTDPGKSTKFLRSRRQELLEMFVAREVDNFQVYLVDAIRASLKKQPNVLKTSSESLTLEYVLEFKSTEELLQAIVEQKVQNLSYEGFGRLRSWCSRKGIVIEIPPDSEASIVELIACRNVIAHNRGVVDQRYLDAVPSSRFKVGSPRELETDDLFGAARLLRQIVQDTDRSLVAKFSLQTREYDFRSIHPEEEPNKSPQRNAGGRPSSDDSPASETPSPLGPVG
ncbi:MAG: hypothetical protein FJ399_00410 [Verrucomicrobia bacterium]|nr:hypothetical protein [Verrucomicrobiota bacterium]